MSGWSTSRGCRAAGKALGVFYEKLLRVELSEKRLDVDKILSEKSKDLSYRCVLFYSIPSRFR